MGRLLKYVFYLAVLLGIGLVGYALIADLPAPKTEITEDVELHSID